MDPHAGPESLNRTGPVQSNGGMGRERTAIWMLAGLVIVALSAAPARAQKRGKKQGPPVAGDYEVTFDEIANNCRETGMRLRKGTFTLAEKKDDALEVSFPMTPVMYGKLTRNGKFRAEAKKGGTAIQGVDGKFSVAGRVDDGVIQLVFIAEYFRGKTPLCTQSWNAEGLHENKLGK